MPWRLASSDKETVAALALRLEYGGPPELLSMRLCLFMDDDATLFNPRWVLHNCDALQAAAHKMREKLGFDPHPSEVLMHSATLESLGEPSLATFFAKLAEEDGSESEEADDPGSPAVADPLLGPETPRNRNRSPRPRPGVLEKPVKKFGDSSPAAVKQPPGRCAPAKKCTEPDELTWGGVKPALLPGADQGHPESEEETQKGRTSKAVLPAIPQSWSARAAHPVECHRRITGKRSCWEMMTDKEFETALALNFRNLQEAAEEASSGTSCGSAVPDLVGIDSDGSTMPALVGTSSGGAVLAVVGASADRQPR